MLYHTQPGDMVVVDARGNMSSGVFGEMMLTYFKGRGGVGVVIDGCIRDYPKAKDIGLGLWLKGATPNFHSQTDIFPFAVNVPVACGGPGRCPATSSSPTTMVSWLCRSRCAGAAGERPASTPNGKILPDPPVRGRRPAQVLSAVRGGPPGVRAMAGMVAAVIAMKITGSFPGWSSPADLVLG